MTKLLLVEDNEMNRDMLSRRLIRRGFQVVFAMDGQPPRVRWEHIRIFMSSAAATFRRPRAGSTCTGAHCGEFSPDKHPDSRAYARLVPQSEARPCGIMTQALALGWTQNRR